MFDRQRAGSAENERTQTREMERDDVVSEVRGGAARNITNLLSLCEDFGSVGATDCCHSSLPGILA